MKLQMRTVRGICSVAITTLLFLSFFPTLPATDQPEKILQKGDETDVVPWFVGEWWSYHIHAISADDTDWNEVYSWINTTVQEVITVSQNGRTYDVYNVTIAGTFVANGTVTVDSSKYPYNISSGTISGYRWVERGDGAIVRENQTAYGTGVLMMGFPFGDRDLQIDGAETVFYNPSKEDLDFPIIVEDEWHLNLSKRSVGYQHYYVDLPDVLGGPIDETDYFDDTTWLDRNYWCNETLTITIPLGSFEVFHVHSVTTEYSDDPDQVSDLWYSPEVKNFVHAETHDVDGPDRDHSWTNLTGYGLLSSEVTIEIYLDPPKVNPGGNITVSGNVSNPGVDLLVLIPFLETSYPTTADITGQFSLNISAPIANDSTPTPVDVGSHGLLVQVDDPLLSGYNVTTIILIMPDLWPSSIYFSAWPLEQDIQVSIYADINTSSETGVYNPILVTFLVDGLPLGNDSFSWMPAGSTLTATVLWTPKAGPRTITVIVDPMDDILESNETNNVLSRSVFVRGPDLTLSSIQITDSVALFYPDAGQGGSGPIPVTFGETIDISFVVTNVGNSTVVDPFAVVVYPTQAYGGPQNGTALFSAVHTETLSPGSSTTPYSFLWTVPNWWGPYYMNITVDPDNNISENYEDNNSFILEFDISGPDYVPWNVSTPIKVSVGSIALLECAVKNVGERNGTVETTIAFYNLTGYFESYTVPPLETNETSPTYKVSWQAPETPGTYFVLAEVDYYGNETELYEENNTAVIEINVTLDPETRIAFVGPNYSSDFIYIRNDTEIGFVAVDHSGSGIAHTYYRVDDGPWLNYTATGPFTLEEEGHYRIQYNSTDYIGGREDTKEVFLRVDKSPPSISVDVGDPKHLSGEGELFITSRTPITVQAVDQGVYPVGLDRIECSVDGGPWTLYTGSFNLTGFSEGGHTVACRTFDLLGNMNGTEIEVILDDSPPSVQISPESEEVSPDANISVEASDELSGVASVEFKIDDGEWSPYQEPLRLDTEGEHTIWIRATDNLGNFAVYNRTFRIGHVAGAEELVNHKPALSVAFAIILFLIGFIIFSHRREVHERRAKAILVIGTGFSATELLIGAASTVVEELRIPPTLGTGTLVDLLIMLLGLGIILLLGKRLLPDKAGEEE